MASKTTTISFKDYFEDEYDFLMAQHNRSLFICELLREYMNGGNIQNVRSTDVSKMPPPPIEDDTDDSNKDDEDDKKEEEKTIRKTRKFSGVVGK